jgi:cell division protein FtsI/penicillin-binding protein 2
MFMNKKRKTHVPFRLNLLFFIVFLLFAGLIMRLGVVQIVYGEDYVKEVNRTENMEVSVSVPRGIIYDREHRTIVDNVARNAITYTKPQGTKPQELLEIAQKIDSLLKRDMQITPEEVARFNELSDRDKKEYWIFTRPEKAAAKLTVEEKKGDNADTLLFERITNEDLAEIARDEIEAAIVFGKISSRDFKDYWILSRPEEAAAKLTDEEKKKKNAYQIQLDRITDEDIAQITKDEIQIVYFFREMVAGTALTPKIIKKGITTEELAIVSEHLGSLPNIDVTTDWDRDPHVEILGSVLGSISSADEGLPADKLDYFLARGYSRDDRVGKSQLEEQYEEVLSGQKKKIRNITDKAGNVLSTEVVNEGKSGNDLVLSIDFELQAEVEKILAEQLLATKSGGGARFLDRAYVVMMNPMTGEVLSLAGKELVKENGKFVVKDHALGTFTTAYAMGSAVKGATVLTGLEAGVINPGTTIYDRPMYFAGMNKAKASYSTLGNVDDKNALKKSSNVYMFNIALKMMGVNYSPKMSLPLKPSALNNMRSYFHQFGLGVKTEIDLPSESIGYPGKLSNPGLMLDYAIGQFDTYTPLQLAQYVSTIANGGYRLKPQLVKEIRQPSLDHELGPVVRPFQPVILNKIDMSEDYLARVQEGFRRVYQEAGGTATAYFGKAPYNSYKPAGKTGTAESFYFERDANGNHVKTHSTYNLTLVGYAPYDNPEVAFAIVVPDLDTDKNPVNKIIGQKILEKYFELKRANSSTVEGNELIETESLEELTTE